MQGTVISGSEAQNASPDSSPWAEAVTPPVPAPSSAEVARMAIGEIFSDPTDTTEAPLVEAGRPAVVAPIADVVAVTPTSDRETMPPTGSVSEAVRATARVLDARRQRVDLGEYYALAA